MATRKHYKKSKLNRKKCGGKPKSHKKQKLWKMKGCSTKKLRRMQRGGDCGCGAPMLLTQNGGSCGTCGAQPFLPVGGAQSGGSCGACVAYPLQGGVQSGVQSGGALQTHVGSAWTPGIGGWPGVKGDNSGSWLSFNPHKVDLQTQGVISERDYQFTNGKPNPTYFGGSKKGKGKGKGKSKGRNLRGGSLLGNLFQNVKFGVGSAYNTLNGYSAPVNPQPYVQENIARPTLSEILR
jgi:hypothetical protein